MLATAATAHRSDGIRTVYPAPDGFDDDAYWRVSTIGSEGVETVLGQDADYVVTDRGSFIQLRAPAADGDTVRVARTSRFASQVSVLDYGAVGDGVADDAVAIQAAADAAKAAGGMVYAPAGTYRIASTVTIREVRADFSSASVTVDAGSAMLVIGGRASTGSNPEQAFGPVLRTGGATEVPTCRVMGAKGQRIEVNHCDYLQLYADTSTGNSGTDYSIAYSTFHLVKVDKLELSTNDATPNSTTQWINENTFFLKRTNTLIIRGTYNHNHNWFHAGAFEGAAVLDFQVGSSNTVWGARFEGYAADVTFAAGTWANKLICSWESNQATQFYDDPPAAVVDVGEGNIVTTLARMTHRRLPVIVVNQQTCQTFSNVAGATNYERGPNYTTLRGVDVQRYGADTFYRTAWKLVWDSPLIPVRPGEALSFGADEAAFRPRISLYDSSREKITGTSPLNVLVRCPGSVSWSDADDVLLTVADTDAWTLAVVDPSVAFVKFDVTAGSAGTTTPFRRFAIHKLTAAPNADREAESIQQAPVLAAVSASPTRGFAEVGTKVSNIAGGWFTATRALDTSLAAAASSAATTVELAAVTGIASGDVLGIELDSGAWHWTTASGAPAGSVVTLAVALPSAAALGNRVVSNGWTAS